jgi:hypothetical protein
MRQQGTQCLNFQERRYNTTDYVRVLYVGLQYTEVAELQVLMRVFYRMKQEQGHLRKGPPNQLALSRYTFSFVCSYDWFWNWCM